MSTLLTKVGSFFSSISLNLTQWVILSMATVIGGLLAALSLQGSRLHKAQVQLLEQHLQGVSDGDDAGIKTSRDRFTAALNAYRKAQ